MTNEDQNLSLNEAASRFLASLPLGESEKSRQEVQKFARWFGAKRTIFELAPAEVGNYAEKLSLSDTDYMSKLEILRTFLTYAKKKRWTATNLATHLKTKKGKGRTSPATKQRSVETIVLTQEGFQELKAELDSLHIKRREVITEMTRAAADKDFRENAPLHAAREQKGHIEGRIMELEETLKSSVVVTEKERSALSVEIGDQVVLRDLTSGQEMHYTLVSSTEADPFAGKISSVSPIGKAIVGQKQGTVVEVIAPAGKLRCQIEEVKR
ncbi:MAG: transcription elongation factor GreA [Chloroflexota bacterium]